MEAPAKIKAKVCLVGEIGVGKTSLVRRFAFGSFDELYSTTLGINISKKVVQPRSPPPGGPRKVEMILFDVMGQRRFRDMLVESYFKGAQGLLAVWDVTRPETLGEVRAWIDLATEVTGRIPVVIASNKVDLSAEGRSEAAELDTLALAYGAEAFATSAKTGENVETAFDHLAGGLLRRATSKPDSGPKSGTNRSLESLARGLVGDPATKA